MNALTIVALVVGLVCLVGGAELLVKGAASIATRLGVEPVIIGLTVVAFGTSAPELAVSVGASIGGNSDVALGNVVGSNIVNILLILGASAIVGGLAVSQRIVRIDVPLLVVASVAVIVMSLDNRIGRIDGVILLRRDRPYTGWLIRASRRADEPEVVEEYGRRDRHRRGCGRRTVTAGARSCTSSPGWSCSCSARSSWSARRPTSPNTSGSASW